MQFRRLMNPREWMLPLLILAFVSLAVTFLTPVFNTTSRWAVLVGVATWLLLRGRFFPPFRHAVSLWTALFVGWCFMTAGWSEIPDLSLLKAAAFLLTAFTAMAAGMAWVRDHPQQDALSYLLPLTIVAIAAGALGRFSSTATVALSEGVTLYQGAVSGANMFGSMLAMCSPLVLWKVYSDWQDRRKRYLWLALLCALVFYLLAAKSRSALLAVLCASAGMFLGANTRKRLPMTLAVGAAVAALWLLAPWAVEQIEKEYVYKHTTDEGLLYSRLEVWEESYEQAAKGGWLGGGYGVTIGDLSFEGNFTAVGYGREKANSQLAVLEETGVVGLFLYALMLGSLFITLFRGLRRQRHGGTRLQLYLVTGMLSGMVGTSVFEAWWVAPSSPESVYFWVLVGVGLALASVRTTEDASLGRAGSHPLRNIGHPAARAPQSR